MKLCDDGHEEVCYEATECPACEALRQVENLEEEYKNLEDENEKLEEALESAKSEE